MEILKKVSKETCDDFVEYTIHPVDFDTSKDDNSQKLQNLRDECLSIISSYIVQYMWHQDPFTLRLKENNLYGRVKFGDNVEDEWYVISLLFKLTKLKPDIIIRVTDQDGEILLIEAAEYLPEWAEDPDTTENRVFIYQNQLHLIPVAQNPSQLTPLPAGIPSIEDAINTIHKFPEATRASLTIQSVLKKRMKSYPDDWSDDKQFIHAIVPIKVKILLSLAPQYLLSAAIRCFYMRDEIDLRKCRQMKYFPPENLNNIGLTLSKCLYAMLVTQQYKPDKNSRWAMPAFSQIKNSKAADLGFKITCGFEMLLAQCKASQSCDSDTSEFDEVRYSKFEKTLIANGYFRDELKGSKNWNVLTAQAKEYFSTSFQPKVSPDEIDGNETFSNQLAKLVNQIEAKYSTLIQHTNEVQNEEVSKQPDDDSWLDFEPVSFDAMLKKHFDLDKKESSTNSANVPQETSIPSQLKKFLGSVSNFEGVDSLPEKMDECSEMKLDIKDFESALKKIVNEKDDVYNIESSDEEEMYDKDDLSKDFKSSDPEWNLYKDHIENELKNTKILPSTDTGDLIESIEDLDKPVDIDLGVFKNIMESLNSQGGMPGPAGTILQSLNVNTSDEL